MCGKAIADVSRSESSDENDPDRVFILRNVHKNYLYYRNLQNFVASFLNGVVDMTGVAGPSIQDENGSTNYDYSQNIYKGYCRKLEAVLGGRMPNAIAVPDKPDDETSIRATKMANNAALYFREKNDLQLQSLFLVFGLFNFGTMFWHIDYVVDEDKYGTKPQDIMEPKPTPLGNASFNCPQCTQPHDADPANPVPPTNCAGCGAPLGPEHYQPPTMVDMPTKTGVQNVPKGGLEITQHNASEITVPLDATCIDTCEWLRWERESHKARLLRKWGNALREKSTGDQGVGETVASQYAESIRSAMASPIGLVRTKRANRWTVSDEWWVPAMYEMVDDTAIRDTLKQNFPSGLRITSVRGKVVDLQEEKLADRWQECKPEPAARIMAEPLGNDWVETQDIQTNTLNQCNEIIERSTEPGFYDPTRIDSDAMQTHQSLPGEYIPALRPAGGSLSDIVHRQEPLTFSEQIPAFRAAVEETAKNLSGLLDPIWGGGDAEEPTARQSELKKNAALMQLGVPWTMIGKSLEKVYEKCCRLISQYEDGVLEFSKKNQFGQFDQMEVVVADLKDGKYHFEADEAIPMTWGQQRDLLMWMLDKPAELLQKWGMDDPLNIFEFKQLLGMPGERVPMMDDRDKCMDVIAELLTASPLPGQPGPDGQPGDEQPTIPPDWEDDSRFCSNLAKAYLQVNHNLAKTNNNGYRNVQAWGKAHFAIANKPAPAEPPKTSVSLSLKGADLGDPAVQDASTKAGIIDPGTQVAAVIPPPKGGLMPPPGPPGQPAPPIQ